MMDYVENKPLAEMFNLSPWEFADVSVFSLPFPIRILNRFRQNSIYTVKDLLLVDISFLKDIPGFGANSLSQVLDYCGGLSKPNTTGIVTVRPKENVSPLFTANKDAIALGDFSFADGLDLSDEQKKQLEAYKSAYEDLGEDIVFDCICSPEKITPLVEALSTIANRCLTLKKLEKYYYQIPSLRRNNAAKYYIDAYSYDENTRSLLTKCYSSPDDVLGAIIYSINVEDSVQVMLAKQFLKWCMFDLSQEIAELFDKIYTNPRIRTVIESRARGLTLNDLGKQLGITRERVRQIEAKAKSRFVRQAGRLKIMSKLYADQNGQSIITLEDVESVSGKNASALIYLLKDSKGSAYTYDHQLDAFVIGDNDFSSRIQDYIDSLPDVLHKADYADALKTAYEEYDLDTEYVVKAINEVYKTTGDVLHRSRLSLAKIYDAILRKYYSAGIHVYDDNEIDDLRQHIYTDYGSIKLPSSSRAIAARISSICMLAGRGIYIPKKEKWISTELAQKLLSYIMDSENPIFFIGNIFSVFEEELVKEGIDNRFYLQGVLRELFGDKLYFRRDYVSKDKSFTSIYSSIVAFIKGAKYLVKKDELKIQFKGITDVVIALATSDSDILNYYGEYLHASNLVVRETEKNYLTQYLASLMDDGEAHHIKDIYDDINRDRPELFSRNAVIRPYSAFSVIEYLFREQYQFSRPYIALNSVEIGRPNERLLELLYSMDQFTVTDITEFAKDNHMLIRELIDFINSLNDKYLLVDVDTLISIDEIGVNSSIAAEVETLICNEISDTMPIRELQCVSRFPQINVTWNEWLVYSILKKWSTKLDVTLSSSQLRQSIPLVSIAGKMDESKYKDVSTEPVHIKADNMDDIEENTQQEKDKMRDSIPQNSDETLSEEEMEDDSNMDQFLGSMSVQGDFKCALKKALEDIEEGKFYFKDCFAVNKLTLGAISNIIKERMAPDQTKINEIQAKIKEIEESTKKRIKAIAKGEYDRFIKVVFGKTMWATMSEEQKVELRSKLAEQELDAMNEEITPFTKQIEDLQNTSDAKRVISIVLESLKDKSLSSLDMIDKTFEKAKMSDSSESEKDKMRDSIPQNSEKTPMVNEIPSEEGMENDSNSDPLPAGSFDAEFYNWLCNTEGMAVNTCRSYVSSLHTAEKYAKEHGFKTTVLCTKDSDVSLATTSALMQNADFRKFNQKNHNNFSAAFQKLNRFFAYLHPEKFGMIQPIKRIPAEPASEKGGCIEQKYRQPQWDIYEAAILLDGYLKTVQKKEPRTHTIKRISDVLRTMAVNRGISIDSVYRNEKGISNQLYSMESAFLGHKVYNPATRLFQEIVQLYQNNHEKYLEILMEAKGRVAAKPNNKEAFLAWAATIVSAGKYKWVDSNISRVKQFGINTKQISGSIYDVTDLNTLDDLLKSVRKSKIFRIKNRKHYNQILADFSLYIRYCLQREKEVESTDSIDSTAEVDKTGITTTTVSQDTGGFMLVDFCNIGSMEYTQPLSFEYKDKVFEANKWGELYVKLISMLRVEYSPVFMKAEDKAVFNTGELMIASEGNKDQLKVPRKSIGAGQYIDANCPATRIVKRIKRFLDLCKIDYSQLLIRYKKTNDSDDQELIASKPTEEMENDSNSEPLPTGSFDAEFYNWICNTEGMAVYTCRDYVKALHTAEKYAKEHGLKTTVLCTKDSDVSLATASALMQNADFRKFNQKKHYNFSAAFQKLNRFFAYLHPEKFGMIQPIKRIPAKPASEKRSSESISPTLAEAVDTLIKGASEGITKDEICSQLSNYNTHQINLAIAACHAVLVLKKYYHPDNISDYQEMADILLKVITLQFSANGNYTSAQQLYNEARSKLDDFLFYNDAFDSRQAVYDLAVHLFVQEKYKGNSFIFMNNMHIWKEEPDYPKDYHGLLIKYAREHGNVFSREEAISYFDQIGSPSSAKTFSNVLFNNGSRSFLQYSENQFMLTEALHVNDYFLDTVKTQIENLLEGEDYIAMGEIGDYFYTTLPSLPGGVSWSALLLEDLLRVYDIGFATMEAGSDNGKRTVPAAIVRKNSPFRTFSDVVWNEVSKSFTLPKEFTAQEFREFLLDKGFIRGSEKMHNVHKTVAGDIKFFWTDKNGRVTIN